MYYSAYNRNRRYRRTYRRNRRTYRSKYKGRYSRSGTKSLGRLSDATQYRFKRSYQIAAGITNSTTQDTFGALYFNLQQLPQYQEFQNLFDFYKITGVKLRFVPSATGRTNAGGTVQDTGQFIYCPDYDDSFVPTNMNDLYQRQSTRIRNTVSYPFNLFIRPKPQVSMIGGYAQPKSQWLSTDSTSVAIDHYGLKWGMRQTDIVIHIDVFATFYLKFKNVK